MRILLDECVPRALRRHLPGHEALTAPEMGWSGKKNGELMRLAAANGFEVFVTVDQNVKFQQHLQNVNFGIIVLSARSNRVAELAPLLPKMLAMLPTIKPGTVVEITA